jgi:hypothetical protein
VKNRLQLIRGLLDGTLADEEIAIVENDFPHLKRAAFNSVISETKKPARKKEVAK